MFKRDKSLFEQLVRQDTGQRPNIVSVPLKSGQLATMKITEHDDYTSLLQRYPVLPRHTIYCNKANGPSMLTD